MSMQLYVLRNPEGNYLALSPHGGTTWTENFSEALFTPNYDMLRAYSIVYFEEIIPVTLTVEQ